MPSLRDKDPVRNCSRAYNNYRKYKENLRTDFYKQCGYCSDNDFYSGGKLGFHIDHFRPHSKFPGLINEYSNLIYSCPYCNNSKSNDWPAGNSHTSVKNGKGYIDPCDPHYQEHLKRDDKGKIISATPIGQYMYKHLKLGLARHQIIWLREQVKVVVEAIIPVLKEKEKQSMHSTIYNQLQQKYIELTEHYLQLENIIREMQ